jgi:hypothetical protein
VHTAPPVRVSVGRSRGWALFTTACAASAAANGVAWLWLQAQWQGAAVAATLAGLLAAAVAAWCAQRSARAGELAWDGTQWHWQGSHGQAHVALDFDRWLLLRFEGSGRRRQWIAASRASTLGPWPTLRAALYSKRPADPLGAPPA